MRSASLFSAAGWGLLGVCLAAWLGGSAWLDVSEERILGGGDQPDWTGTLWLWWWVGEALRAGRSPLDAAANFHPFGQDLVAWGNVLDAALGAPLLALAGPVHGFNLAVGLALASAGWAAAFLARRVGASAGGAAVAMVGTMTSTTLLVELTDGRVSQALVAPMLLGFAGLVSIARRGGPWLAGAGAASASAIYWFHGVFFAIGAIVAAPFLPRRPLRWAAAAALAGVLVAPLAVPVLQAYGAMPGVARALEPWMEEPPWNQGSFGLSMATFQGHSPLWPVWDGDGEPSDKRVSVLLLGCAAVGAALGRGRARSAALAWALAGYVLTLGPWLKTPGGSVVPVPLPWLGLARIAPIFERLWWPERAELLLLAGLAPLAALGADRIAARVRLPSGLTGAVLAVALALETHLLQPYHPLVAAPARPWSAELYAGLDGALVTTPVAGTTADSRHALWLQVHHGQPILGGLGDHLPAHRPAEWSAFVQGNGVLHALSMLATGGSGEVEVRPADVDALRAAGFRWVVVDPAVFPPGFDQAWVQGHREVLRAIFGAPERRSGKGLAWSVDPIAAPVTVRLPGALPSPAAADSGRSRPSKRKAARGQTGQLAIGAGTQGDAGPPAGGGAGGAAGASGGAAPAGEGGSEGSPANVVRRPRGVPRRSAPADPPPE